MPWCAARWPATATAATTASRIPDADVASEPHVHSELHYARKAGGDKNDDGSDIDHRGDAWIRTSDKQAEHKWLVDVTVVHPPRPSNDAASAAEPGTAAETAAAKKVDNYTRNCTIPSRSWSLWRSRPSGGSTTRLSCS